MTTDGEPIEIDDNPELLRLVEAMEAAGRPCVLRRRGKDVAVIRPADTETLARMKPTTADSPLWRLVGIGSSEEPTDVAAHKDEYLADAKLNRRE